MAARLNTESFISRAIEVHGDRYDYSESKYINARTKVEIGCRVHGKFSQSSHLHLAGSNCPKCVGLTRMTTSEFINKAKEVHGSKYDYSDVEYKNNKTDVAILCPEHGEFYQKPNNHLSGHGCTFCGNNLITEFKDFVLKARKVHGTDYEYSKSGYRGVNNNVAIVCREHGPFVQSAAHHLKGSGCPKCKPNYKMSTGDFIRKAEETHQNKYSYSQTSYTTSKDKLTINCPVHGSFSQTADFHIQGGGCPKCANPTSKAEYMIKEAIESAGFEVAQSDRKILNGLELDLVIHGKKTAIEFNGIHWHSDVYGRDKNYHLNKTNQANRAGYRLIHIWEDDFSENPEREIKFILNALGVDQRKAAYARKTKIHVITTSEASKFLSEYHIQGSVGSSVKLGTFLDNELVAVALFTKRSYGYELVRYATSVHLIGGLGKVVKHFYKKYKLPIHSFCDLSRHNGRSYEAAGFVETGKLPPDYKYAINGKREHKFGFRLNSIKTKFPHVYSPDKTERQMMEEAGIPRVWDCGKVRYIFG